VQAGFGVVGVDEVGESFGGWTKTFTDPRLCAASVDRLTFGGNIIETGTDSYRLAKPAPEPSTNRKRDRRPNQRPDRRARPRGRLGMGPR